jgi:hypothetical protein
VLAIAWVWLIKLITAYIALAPVAWFLIDWVNIWAC